MYTQILSKNELVINAEEEKGEGETENKQNKRMQMVNTEKRKEKLNYQHHPCLVKINENKKLGSPVHSLDQRTPGLGKNSSTIKGPRRCHGTSRSTSQCVPNMLFSI